MLCAKCGASRPTIYNYINRLRRISRNLGEYEFPRKRVLMPQICLASTADLTAARYQLPRKLTGLRVL